MAQPGHWLKQLAAGGLLRLAILPLSAVCAVLTARITIMSTGVEAYGYINTVAMLFLLIPFSDLGVGATVSNTVARRNESPNGPDRMYGAVIGSVRVLIVVCVVLTLTTVCLVYTGILVQGLGLPDRVLEGGETPIFLAFFAYFCSVPLSVGLRMLIGYGGNTLIALSSAIAPATTLAYSFVISLTDGPPLLFALGPALGVLLTNLFATVCAFRRLGVSVARTLTDVPRLRSRPGAKVMDTAWPMWIIGTTFTIIFYSHRILLANFSSDGELATYALAVQLFFPAWSVVYMAATILWSEFARSHDKFRTWVQANAILVLVSMCGALALYFVGPPVVKIMSPGSTQSPATVLLAFGVLMVVMSLDVAQTMLLVSASELRTRAYFAIGVTTIFALLCVPAIQLAGSEGIIWLMAGAFFHLQTVPNLISGYRKVRREAPVELQA